MLVLFRQLFEEKLMGIPVPIIVAGLGIIRKLIPQSNKGKAAASTGLIALMALFGVAVSPELADAIVALINAFVGPAEVDSITAPEISAPLIFGVD